eukprot:GHVQ01032050.1.p1 GENE.GHVQ01032050.1~~GHVQ01032050.1.p1  ORF type:complete len:385 (+),score=49.51 GHVQ01032050.1:401-1555(+)
MAVFAWFPVISILLYLLCCVAESASAKSLFSGFFKKKQSKFPVDLDKVAEAVVNLFNVLDSPDHMKWVGYKPSADGTNVNTVKLTAEILMKMLNTGRWNVLGSDYADTSAFCSALDKKLLSMIRTDKVKTRIRTLFETSQFAGKNPCSIHEGKIVNGAECALSQALSIYAVFGPTRKKSSSFSKERQGLSVPSVTSEDQNRFKKVVLSSKKHPLHAGWQQGFCFAILEPLMEAGTRSYSEAKHDGWLSVVVQLASLICPVLIKPFFTVSAVAPQQLSRVTTPSRPLGSLIGSPSTLLSPDVTEFQRQLPAYQWGESVRDEDDYIDVGKQHLSDTSPQPLSSSFKSSVIEIGTDKGCSRDSAVSAVGGHVVPWVSEARAIKKHQL